ncbi:MAG: Ornithine carbamoyltransferase [Planctomycetes bacterium ADurb.Bin412]|nr:MAG: Ornithine carbamoyltransferase [Planctomycetes bacterium ADurb.Bin412]
MTRHFLEIEHYSPDELHALLIQAACLKRLYLEGGLDPCLKGKTMAVLFEKPSLRTRISFEVGMAQLGGATVYLRPEDMGGLGQREPIRDLMRVLNGYVNAVVVRTFGHELLLELAHHARIPVINALTDLAHPCQAMADMLTIQEHFGELAGRKVVFVGDGNNVARSLAWACMKLGLHFVIASPEAYALPEDFVSHVQEETGPGRFSALQDPWEAVREADVVYSDTWTSMGQEKEKEQRIRDFAGYQITRDLMAATGKKSVVMHCLPAYRGLEITDEVIESPQSIVFAQAENRLHFQRALLKYLILTQ